MRTHLEIVEDETGASESVSLYDVCQWFVDNYPDDIFTTEGGHPVSKMRDLAKTVLAMKTKEPLSGGEQK